MHLEYESKVDLMDTTTSECARSGCSKIFHRQGNQKYCSAECSRQARSLKQRQRRQRSGSQSNKLIPPRPSPPSLTLPQLSVPYSNEFTIPLGIPLDDVLMQCPESNFAFGSVTPKDEDLLTQVAELQTIILDLVDRVGENSSERKESANGASVMVNMFCECIGDSLCDKYFNGREAILSVLRRFVQSLKEDHVYAPQVQIVKNHCNSLNFGLRPLEVESMNFGRVDRTIESAPPPIFNDTGLGSPPSGGVEFGM